MSDPAITLREAALHDVEAMARVVVASNAVLQDLLPEASFVSREESAANWQRCLQEKPANEYLFVAEDASGQVIGLAMCGPESSGDGNYGGEVYIICVDPACQRQGVGRRLLRQAAEWLTQDGITSLLICCLAVNPNRGFYERLGGEVVRERTRDMDGITVAEVAYGWPDTRILYDHEGV